MPAFRYRAMSPAGEAQQGLLDAPDLDQAVDRLHNMGLVPVRIEAQGTPKLHTDRIPFMQKKVAPRDLILFTRQLSSPRWRASTPRPRIRASSRPSTRCARTWSRAPP